MTTSVAETFVTHEAPVGPTLVCKPLQERADHLFTTRAVSFRGRDEAREYGQLASSFGLTMAAAVLVSQVHGRSVLVVRPDDPAVRPDGRRFEADAVVSTDPARVIGVRVADCVPILLADSARRVVAAVHAGWRGTCAGVAMETVHEIERIGVPPSDLLAAIGPSIGPCCYTVGEQTRATFLAATPDAAGWFIEDGERGWKLNLWQANVDQLASAGVPLDAIHLSSICTADHLDTCFSYRKEGPAGGRMIAAIRRRGNP
jgi:YfiH family protein